MPGKKRTARIFLFLPLLLLFAAGCSSSGSGTRAGGPSGAGGLSGPAVDISGGAGSIGSGGSGDQEYGIWFDSYGPLGVKVYATGSADASFTLDLPVATPEFGGEAFTVTTSVAVPVYGSDPADNNVYYFLRGDSTLYHKIDDSTINAVTGIRVNAGATLTLPINQDRDGSGRYESAVLSLANDLEVLGTLRTAAFDDPDTQESGESVDRAGLVVNTSGGVFVRATGVVSTAGDNAASGRGGYGGGIEVVAYWSEAPNSGIVVNQGLIDASGGSTADPAAEGGNSAVYGAYGYCVNLYADSGFVNTGSIRADGGNGGAGGGTGGWYGNSFYVGGPGTLRNTGAISMSGGTGSAGAGGNGGDLDVEAGGVSLHSSGAISVRGGNGAGSGGTGGNVDMYVYAVGDLLSSGAIDASGGDSTGTGDTVATRGGGGGQVYLYTYGGKLISSGAIDAGGGDVANTNAGSYGGQGGYLDIESYPDYWSWTAPAGAMEISGDILLRGGAGPNGGYGGAVYMYYGDSGGTGGIVLRGYAGLVADGGTGVASGGDGGGVYLYDYYSGGAPGAGGLLAETGLSANGGNATDSGGYGGYVELWSQAPPSQYRGVTVDGGAGTSPGGAGTIVIDGGGPV